MMPLHYKTQKENIKLIYDTNPASLTVSPIYFIFPTEIFFNALSTHPQGFIKSLQRNKSPIDTISKNIT